MSSILGIIKNNISNGNNASNSTKETFVAIDAQTVFNLSSIPNNVDVDLDRVAQLETIDYNINEAAITFTEALEAGSIVIVRKY